MKSRSSFVTVIAVWCLLITAVPLLMDRAPVLSAFLFLSFSPICHQIPERSFFILGHQLPVCARCAGIYFGGLLGSFFVRKKSPPPLFLVLALIPMAIDGGTQLLWRESTNIIRLATGLVAGFAVVFYLYPGLSRNDK